MSDVRVTVEYFAQARAAAGVASESLTLQSPATLLDLARELSRRHGAKLESLLLTADGLSPSIIFAVDGRQAPPGGEVQLDDGANVVIIPPISGGAA